MKKIIILLMGLLPTLLFAQDFIIKNNSPLQFINARDGLRTVWFSSDNTKIFGDFENMYGWEINSQAQVFNHPIGGYVVHPSTVNNAGDVWVQGRSAYKNPEKPDITQMYSVITIVNPFTGEVSNHPTKGFDVWNTEFIAGTNKVVAIISDSKTYTNSAIVYDIDTKTVERKIVAAKSMDDVMATVKVSANGKYLAIGYVGTKTKVVLYDFETAKRIKTFYTDNEVVDMALTDNLLIFAEKNAVFTIDLEKLRIENTLHPSVDISFLTLSPNAKTIAVGGMKGCDLIDIDSKIISHFTDDASVCCAFSPNGEMLAVGMNLTLKSNLSVALKVWVKG